MGKVVFKTLRELGALIELRGHWETLPLQTACSEIGRRVALKEISPGAMKIAYAEGICRCAIDESNRVKRVGVWIEGEDETLSDAITDLLVREETRPSTKAGILMTPNDSIVTTCEGEFKKMEMVVYYEHLPDMKKRLEDMEQTEAMPKCLFILTKSSFTEDDMDEVKRICLAITTKLPITLYVSSDFRPFTCSREKDNMICAHHDYLLYWRFTTPPVNVVLITNISGTLGGSYPLRVLINSPQSERKELIEEAILHLVEGTPFCMPRIEPSTD